MINRRLGCHLLLLVLLPSTAPALTRWSSLHIIPDADFVQGSSYVADYHGYFIAQGGSGLAHTGIAHIGLSEWADFSGGYAGGPTLGLKAKVMGEGVGLFPSVAVGMHNLLTHVEDNYYAHTDTATAWDNEFFVVVGKSIEEIRTRFHAGVQTMPSREAEKVDYFFGAEKYLGGFAYLTIEAWLRDKVIRPSVFANARLFKSHLEFSVGAVDILGMVRKKPGDLVKPGIYFGVRFQGNFSTTGAFAGFGSLEEQLKYHQTVLKSLKGEVDSLKRANLDEGDKIDSLNKSFSMIADSAMGMSTGTRMRTFALEKIILINTLLGQENMDAGRIKNAQKEVVAFGELMVAPLKEITLDNQLGRKVHTTAMSLMGRLNNAKAADAILELMAQSVDPEVKIEGLIAMEKNKELRAGYLLKQLANDPNESVAFTAAEVFRKLEKLMPKDDLMQAPRSSVLALSIPESKIGEDDSGAVDTVAPAPDTTAKPATADSVVTIKATNTKPQSKIAQMIFMLKDDELVPVPAKSTGDTAVKVDSLKKTAADTVSKTPKAPVKADSVALKSADTVKAPVSPVKPVDTLKPLAPTTPARPAVPEKKK